MFFSAEQHFAYWGPNPDSLLDLDRSNIGNARLQGLPEDTLGGDKTGVLFDWLVSAFFLSYVGTPVSYRRRLLRFLQVLFQIPATILSKLFPPQTYVAIAAFGWGMTSTLMVR